MHNGMLDSLDPHWLPQPGSSVNAHQTRPGEFLAGVYRGHWKMGWFKGSFTPPIDRDQRNVLVFLAGDFHFRD